MNFQLKTDLKDQAILYMFILLFFAFLLFTRKTRTMSPLLALRRIFVVVVCILVFFVLHRFFFLFMLDRQIVSEIRRLFLKEPLFTNKYQTPHFRRINLNTKTDLLETCPWIEGQKMGMSGDSLHYGSEQPDSHFTISLGMSEMSEHANEQTNK